METAGTGAVLAPSEKKGLSSSALKIIAIVLMLVDHFAVVYHAEIVSGLANGRAVYTLLRTLARVAFPVFAYLIAEGARRTSNINKYMLRLLAFAFVSEVPFDLAMHGKWLEFTYQNVFFTLLMGLFCIFCFQKLEHVLYGLPAVPVTLAMLWLAEFFVRNDYGAMGVLVIVLFYWVQKAPKVVRILTVPVICLLLTVYPIVMDVGVLPERVVFNDAELFAVAAAPLILLYSGKKGVKINRWFFYAFYPAHLFLLWLTHFIIFGN